VITFDLDRGISDVGAPCSWGPAVWAGPISVWEPSSATIGGGSPTEAYLEKYGEG